MNKYALRIWQLAVRGLLCAIENPARGILRILLYDSHLKLLYATICLAMSQLALTAEMSPMNRSANDERDFREIGFDPSGSTLLFIECVRPSNRCDVMRYSPERKTLERYELPGEYFYTSARFSPRGTYVVMSRVPKADARDAEKVRAAYEGSQIAFVTANGSKLTVLPIQPGNKIAPFMSSDEERIAFWRSDLRPSGSKTSSSHFDIYETRLVDMQETQFAGPYKFFERTTAQYISIDEIMVGADGPAEYALDVGKYWRKYNRSAVYLLKRGERNLPKPALTEVEHASFPCLDRASNLYFYGQRPGASLFRKSPSGQLQQWTIPSHLALGGLHDLAVSSDGKRLAFIYSIGSSGRGNHSRAIGLLDVDQGKWIEVAMPSFSSAAPVGRAAAR